MICLIFLALIALGIPLFIIIGLLFNRRKTIGGLSHIAMSWKFGKER